MQNLLDNLNPEQLAAVTLPAQSGLILAGAGSGKTRVLITRIAWLIQTGQVSPGGILAVTFTNKASKEMQTRLSAMLPINTRGMWIGTFHGLCNRLLRAHFRDAGLPQTFQILDSQDQLSAIKRLLKSLNVDDEKYPPRNLMYFINGAKDQGLRAKDVDASDDYSRKLTELYELYDQQCQREGVVDFAELLLRTYELLTRNQPLREHYQARFRHILVDEFQDTNDLQYKWLKLLAGPHNAVFAVGDDDQSIYAFRGANVGNMSAFEREFKVQNLIKLEQNYRSHGHILDAANFLIANNTNRLGKNLRTDAGHGEQVRVFESTSDLQEAQWIVEQVKSLINDGASRSEIALLYRSNAQSRVLEHALFSAGIPYRVYGGQRYFERAEIKHAIAYLQLMDNLHNDSAFLRVVNFPTRGIGAKSLEHLQDAARQYGISLYAAVPYVSGKAGTSLAGFIRLIEGARFEAQNLPLPEMVNVVLQASGLLAHYGLEREGADRIENLEQLVNAATVFINEEGFGHAAPAFLGPQSDAVAGLAIVNADGIEIFDADAALPAIMSPLSAFLSHASLEAGDNQAQVGQDALQLMTVHAAKGLEFDAVFITGLEEGLFPHENSAKEEGGVEEERRLMYVAITRARHRLFMTLSQTRMLHGQTRYNLRSRFFDELPEETLKWLSAKVQQPQWYVHPKAAWAESSLVEANTIAQKIGKADIGWRIGESVAHAKFGEGVIVNIEGSAGNARAQINFGRHGMKLLDLSIAKLDRL
ncbi:UvrD-helicase domain-containing protein [Herbaspirillum sp. RTI4]|uniref:UvrD-helicase domain-containing protein n=1 Tax=Herbaspirillum sp. RTI4 TaxID=3048640 RepID=UPI002AB4B4C5|nr:UvrD-helicase domain-containing protein [Herbaspirillum sp. RTI4]MDY7577564.1 UvrD-helicase domain-containing protein [Herbaspirillum sp. RTI4]MEA9981039.1 UvrD-helicase domain-containing protein [Herbaspirillum sp. RTI4]